ncbi:phage Gp37/Gp68 family protein [Micromonospora lupini]|uniref:DUF5131 family protein n=1 Tax=Micromonospora lupini TaxID=285679 RepID=UPI00225B8F31|nr:DUF5131 family protein [Micromonospora lupini]MCX5066604.1 phage Gp37/Gp68 family protein [Micromonospora lupini]
MAEFSGISWCDHTFNPWWGCAKVSPACRFCYANTTDTRWGGKHWGRTAPRRMMSEGYWAKPKRWNREALAAGKPLFVFAASMADVFEDHPDVPDARRRLWDLIEQTPALVWMLLTKRPENVAAMVPWDRAWPSNVWLGVSAENQRFADQRIPLLLTQSATRKFVSAAPLLGPVNLDPAYCDAHGRSEVVTDEGGQEWCGYCAADGFTGELSYGHWLDPLNGGIDWVITEGESGAKARPTHPDWFRSLRDQCQTAGVYFHHKQNGEWHHRFPADWSPADAWTNPQRHRWVDPVTGKTKPFAEFTGTDDRAWAHVARVGLKAAGRLLDGELHDARPFPVGAPA